MKKIIIAQGKYSIAGAIFAGVALIMAIVVINANYLISVMSPSILRWLIAGCVVCCITAVIGLALCVAGLVKRKLRGLAIAGLSLSVLTLVGIPYKSYRAMEMCHTNVKMPIYEDVPIPDFEEPESIVRIVLNAEGDLDCTSLESEGLTTRFSLNDEDVVRNLHNWLSSVSDKEKLSTHCAISIRCDSDVTFSTLYNLYDALQVSGCDRVKIEKHLDEDDEDVDDEEDDDF